MKNRNYGLYAIAVAIAVVGALALGVPVSTLGFLAIVLVCPLMMLFMMRGMQGDDGHHAAGGDERERTTPQDHTAPQDHTGNR